MAIKNDVIKAFKAKGIRVDSRIKTKQAVKLIHAIFSGYLDSNTAEALTTEYTEAGAILQTGSLKGYVFLSYPDNDDGKELLHRFNYDLAETGNRLRFIGNTDKLCVLNGRI